jgi:hypothetical protein
MSRQTKRILDVFYYAHMDSADPTLLSPGKDRGSGDPHGAITGPLNLDV